jgi:hypothetical protein
MSRRIIGAILIAVAGWLLGARYLTAAIFGSGLSTWNADMFQSMLQYVGPTLHTWSIIALAGGLIYLVWGEFDRTG